EIEPVMEQLKKDAAIPDEKYYNMMIAITEAVNNAIVHGNKLDSSKNVLFIADVVDKHVIIEIEDCGCGFDPENIADPRAPENLLKEGGRGVFIIKSLADEVIYMTSESGTKLKLIFKF
ncbi:MAG: ATP-binding protein, partial [Candidatus Kapaibacterium sp.]